MVLPTGGLQICYSEENTPLFTGGAIKKALEQIKGDHAFVINGDTYFDIDFALLLSYAKKRHAQMAIALKEMRNFFSIWGGRT